MAVAFSAGEVAPGLSPVGLERFAITPGSWVMTDAGAEPGSPTFVVTMRFDAAGLGGVVGCETFEGRSTLTVGERFVMGVCVRGQSAAGDLSVNGTVVGWAIPRSMIGRFAIVGDADARSLLVGVAGEPRPLFAATEPKRSAPSGLVACDIADVRAALEVRPQPAPAPEPEPVPARAAAMPDWPTQTQEAPAVAWAPPPPAPTASPRSDGWGASTHAPSPRAPGGPIPVAGRLGIMFGFVVLAWLVENRMRRISAVNEVTAFDIPSTFFVAILGIGALIGERFAPRSLIRVGGAVVGCTIGTAILGVIGRTDSYNAWKYSLLSMAIGALFAAAIAVVATEDFVGIAITAVVALALWFVITGLYFGDASPWDGIEDLNEHVLGVMGLAAIGGVFAGSGDGFFGARPARQPVSSRQDWSPGPSCTSCGSPLEAGARFCESCGAQQ